MSRRIMFVGEGKTDFHVFKAALMALPQGDSFVPSMIQPPLDQLSRNHLGDHGGGWRGVFGWCHSNFGKAVQLTLANARVLVIHIDGDIVMDDSVYDVAPKLADCDVQSVQSICDAVESELRKAIGLRDEERVVCMIPCMATEAWMIPAFTYYTCPKDVEALQDPGQWLNGKRPRLVRSSSGRIRKLPGEYLRFEYQLTREWSRVCSLCTSAERFSSNLQLCLSVND